MTEETYIRGKAKSELIKKVIATLPNGDVHPEKARIEHISRKYLDLPFCDLPDSKMLDIYLPDEGERPFPVLMYFFGGGFLTGDKRDMQINIALLQRRFGFAIVGVNYTRSSEGEYPRLVHEIKAATRYLRAHAAEYHLDPARFIAMGCSAGGHLAALLGTSAGVAEVEDLSYGNADYSSEVQGVIDLCGTIDYLTIQSQIEEHVQNTGIVPGTVFGKLHSIETLLFGDIASEVPEKVRAFSPITHVHANVPPFLIIHGLKDIYCPPQQSIVLADAIRAKAGEGAVELHLIEEAGHCDLPFLNHAFPIMGNFLKKYL